VSYGTCVIDHVKGMNVNVPVWDALAGLASSPPPPPSSVTWSRRGGEGWGMAGRVLPGNSERGRGELWQVYFAGGNRVFIPRNNLASHFGVSIRRIFIGGSIWQINLAGKFGKFIQQVLEKEIKAKKRK
jgi:hypothetical protein